MERVSTSGLNHALLRSAMTVQARLADRQTAQASGLETQTYAGLGADSARLISLESQMTAIQGRSATTQTALDRTEAMHQAVGSMVDLMTSLRSTLSEMTAQTADQSVDRNATGSAMLEDLAALMNLQVDGRYLFAGGATTSPPVDLTALSSPASAAIADTGYYQGDASIQSVAVSDQSVVAYGINADETGFEKAIRAANLLAGMDSSDADAIGQAYDLATEAMDALLAVQGRLSVTASRLESGLQTQDSMLTLIAARVSDVKAVDTAQVAVEIAEYQTILEASYAALGKISSLNLLDFL